jgi:trehalose-6-phosphate synthase
MVFDFTYWDGFLTMIAEVVLDRTAAENSVVQSAMGALVKEGKQTFWVGSLSTGSFTAQITESDEDDICTQLEPQHMVPVFLGTKTHHKQKFIHKSDPEQSRLHFRCFSKGFIWPLFHYYGNSSSFSFEGKKKGVFLLTI